ncbi:hypothetical protein D3C84_1028550 [compost metagenome]
MRLDTSLLGVTGNISNGSPTPSTPNVDLPSQWRKVCSIRAMPLPLISPASLESSNNCLATTRDV